MELVTTVWHWEYCDPRTGRWKRLSWFMSDEDAARWSENNQIELRRIEGSSEVRRGYSDMWQLPPRPSR